MRDAGKKNKHIILLTNYHNTDHHIEPSRNDHDRKQQRKAVEPQCRYRVER